MGLWPDYFALLMEFEGETFENDPSDPGGATKYGVDQRSHPGVDIEHLSKGAAEQIYLKEFGESAAALLPSPMSFVYFDTRVNAGERTAAKCLQRAVGVRDDGVAGPATIKAALAMIAVGNAANLLVRMSAQRDLYYLNLAHTRPVFTRFLAGWKDRTKTMKNWAACRLEVGGVKAEVRSSEKIAIATSTSQGGTA